MSNATKEDNAPRGVLPRLRSRSMMASVFATPAVKGVANRGVGEAEAATA